MNYSLTSSCKCNLRSVKKARDAAQENQAIKMQKPDEGRSRRVEFLAYDPLPLIFYKVEYGCDHIKVFLSDTGRKS